MPSLHTWTRRAVRPDTNPRIHANLGLSALLLCCCGNSDFTPDELARLREFTLGPLPPSPSNAVADNGAAARLGQMFFFDARFSGPLRVGDSGDNGGLGAAGTAGLVSCASCHDPRRGGADVRSRAATSLGAAWTVRNAPSVYNAAYAAGATPWQFWDGRKDSLWSQALSPIESPAEHNTSRLQVAHLIAAHYKDPYQALFGPLPDLADADRFPGDGQPGTTAWESMAAGDQEQVDRIFANFGKAIEAYERLLLDRDAPLDRYLAGDASALADDAIRGARLFVGRASCTECHDGPTFSDGRFHNHTVPQQGAAVPRVDLGRAGGIAAVLGDPFNQAGPHSDDQAAPHLRGLTLREADLGAFRTPPLRGVARTAPYMHTGAFATLGDVVAWYRDGGDTDGFVGTRDPAAAPLNLSSGDVEDLVAFLRALSGAPLPERLTTAPELP